MRRRNCGKCGEANPRLHGVCELANIDGFSGDCSLGVITIDATKTVPGATTVVRKKSRKDK